MNSKLIYKQSGFVVLMGVLVLLLGSAFWFGSATKVRTADIESNYQQTRIDELAKIKDRLLTYAVMQPEIFNNVANPQNIPGVGYLPCPDTNGNGNTNLPCGGGGVLVDIGRIPQSIANTMFTFVEDQNESLNYWYAVDSRYVVQNAAFNFAGAFRRFPLNADMPALANLTLDGRNDIVAIIFYSGKEMQNQNQNNILNIGDFLEGENADGDVDFISVDPTPAVLQDFNDYAIAITRQEWRTAMLARVSIDNIDNNDFTNNVVPLGGADNIADLCATIQDVPANPHWFNECTYIGANIPPFACTDVNAVPGGVDNLAGQNWRGFFGC